MHVSGTCSKSYNLYLESARAFHANACTAQEKCVFRTPTPTGLMVWENLQRSNPSTPACPQRNNVPTSRAHQKRLGQRRGYLVALSTLTHFPWLLILSQPSLPFTDSPSLPIERARQSIRGRFQDFELRCHHANKSRGSRARISACYIFCVASTKTDSRHFATR